MELGYEKLLEKIFRRFPSVQGSGFTPGAYKPGLDHMLEFDQALGYPSRALRAIHVAGTNGKGSVANILASAFSSCGYKTGLFTSPHLLDFRERARIDGAMIPKEYVQAFLNEWMPWMEEHDLSFFEITTGLAFKWFSDEKVDIAVIEVGLGGRLDSTNILERPELCIVTSIGLDHMALLGNTRTQIAAEKAGIFKSTVPVVIGEYDLETSPVFEEKSYMFCPLYYASELKPPLWNKHVSILKEMDLQAHVQEKNLRTVLVALSLLKPGFPKLGNENAVIDGIVHTARNMDFHGRWERLSVQPCVIADIGHNAHALKHNFAQLEALKVKGKHNSLLIVYGIMADKDLDAILPLLPLDATYIFASPDTPRALAATEILRRFNEYRRSRNLPCLSFFCGSVRQALQMAIQIGQRPSEEGTSRKPNPLIYVGGSAFVVAEVLPLFK